MPKKSMIKNVRFTKSKIALAIAAQMVFSGNVAGAPASGEIVGGIGGIEQKGTETTIIQSSDRLAIDWKSFDVGKNERVEFVQPGQSAVALNRILGNKGTEILGRIDANGHIILVNPRGVVFGESATINVGGLIASGLQINPDDFMNGDLVFKRIEDSDGTVINSGMINAASGGNVVLLGTQVENRGLISANLGSAILASGKEAVLTFDESGLLGVQVNEAILQQELGEGFAVSNSGEIRAENGRVLLSAATTRDVFSQAVNWGEQKQARSVTYNEDGSFTLGAGGDVTNSGAIIASGENGAGDIVVLGENITNRGAIRADTVRGRAGNIELHSNITTKVEGDGVVTANAEKGGDIKVLGKNVGLFDQAKIESIGNNGGGQVLFGGDREGLNSEIRNADFAYIGENTSIDVSATNNGDGGKAVIFAEDTARVHGSLAVKGGKYGGNGGFIETSGKIGFEIAESPDISAAAGKGGHWLIDPYNIVITSTGTADISGGNFESGKNDARIAVRDVNTALAQNGQVTIQTGRGAKEQDGNITVDAEINFDDDREATLNLIAYNNIEINYSITTGDKTANRKLNIHLNANTSGNQGSITFGNKVRIETGGGDFIVGNIQGESSSPGAFNVDFSNATIDVIRASYTGNELDQLYRNRGTTVTSEQSQHLAPSGRIAIAASNDVILGQMNVKGREDDGSPFKIDIRAGNDITLPQDLMFDNNPTEIFQSGQRSNDGYTTLHLMAGNDIRLNGGIRQEYSDTNAAWSDHHDRLNIVLVADSDGRGGGDVIIGNTIETSGGDFTILNAIDVEMDNNTLDTQSIYRTYDNSLMREIIANYGAGNVSITATGNVTLGDMPMFQQGASETSGQLRNPSLKVSAGETLDIGNSSLYTLDGGITLGAKQWNFNNHSLNTTLGGDITLTSAGNLLLPNIVSTGNLTLASRDAGQTISITGNGLQLNGLLTLDLKDGSANLSNVVSNSSENSANLTIASGHNIQLQTPQAIRLGDSVLTGDLNLTSDVDIRQVGNSSVNVGGSSRFYTGADVILNGLENLFGGSVWVGGVAGDARNINLVSTRDLKLGGVSPGDTNDISLAGTLEAHAGHDITQSGVLSVAQATTLSAGGDITLTQNNKFSSISISHAQSAKIRNQQALRLGEIVNVVRLELDVTGDLSQTAVLNLEELDLAVTGKTQLTQSSNSIGSLSGSVAQSNIAVAGDLKLGDFVVGNDGVFSLHLIGSEATLEVGGNIQLTGVATLTFNDVANFVLRGNVDGVDAVVNSLIVNGAEGNGTYEITAGASWKNISFSINGGEGNDTLKGPNSAATWRIDSESSSLSDGSNALTFSSIENLKGGSGEDAFEFLVLPEGVAIDGGDGTDVADYSRISDASVRLNSNVKGVEEIKGDGSGILVGGDVDTTWIVVAPKMGSVEWEYEIENAETIKDSVKFTGFSQLRGGSGTDYFILKEDFASVEDVESASGVYGGAGNDTFDFQSEFTAVVSGGAGDDTFILSDNARVLNIDGGSGRDKLSGIDGAHLVWEIDLKETVSVSDGQNVYVEKATNISSLEGKDGNDTFLFWAVKTNIGVNGGEGTNTANFSNVEGAFPVYLGSLDESGISNVSTIKGNGQSTLADRGDGGANWHLSSQGGEYKPAERKIVKFSEFNQLVGGSGDDIFTFDADLPGAGANVNGGDGNNEYVFNVGFSANVTGGSGDDRFKVEEGALVTGILDGGLGGNNNLELYDKDLTWIIKAAAANTSVQVKDPLKDTTPVAAAFNITRLKGGEGEDTFKYFVHDRSISADGGRGVNTADFSGVKGKFEVRLGEESAEFGVTNIGHLIGNGATSTLIGSNQNNTWILENNQDYGILKWGPEDNSQSARFSGFGHWVGGDQNDIFILETSSGAPGSIQGGGGNNEVDLSAVNQIIKIGLGTDTSEALNLLDVRKITANPDYANYLTSGASQSDWSITGRNTGTLSQTGTVITFAGFAHLQGLQANTFDIQASGSLGVGSSAGSVQGSLNNSVLKFNENGAYTWTLNGAGEGNVARGGSTLINFSGMTALQGADGRDDFVLKDQKASIGSIDGGGGINSLSTKWNGREPLMWAVVNSEGKLNDHVSSFNNISELIGQSGVDQFHISGSTKLNFIDSGDGNDEIYLSGDSKVDLILAGAGADIIAIAENAFVGNPDISERTSIDGGEGNDTLDLTGLNRKVLWDIANQKIGDFAYLSIEKLKAPNDPANAIQAPNTNNTWTITGINSGELNAGNGVIVSYEGIANLIGGNLRDDFILDSPDAVIGKVDGGLGVNKLQGGDADYRWFLTGENSGYLEKASEKIADFENIQNLTGGSGVDRFEVAENGNLSGWLAGGADDDQIIFSNGQNISVWLADGTGTGPKEGQWWLLRTDIENISAQITEGLNHLQLESKTPRSWTISALNQGKVGDVNFSGFGQLTGGAGDDTFTLEENGSLSGLLDGGLGNNAVDLREWSRSVTVALGERVGADLQVTNIYEINANNSFSNTLWARDEENTWTIDGVNAGRLKAKTRLVFSGFSNLRGGEEKDVFELSAEGMVHGSIDGGSNENKEVVDEVAYIGQKEEFVVNLNGDNRLYNIEHLKGNRYLILQGPDFEAEWEIDGLDRGKLSYGVDQNLSFDSVQRILGGSNVDKFSFKNGGAITNGVDGGDGDDQFFIDLAIGESNLLTKLDGGGGNDFLQFTGGGKGWEAVYRQSADKESWFDFNIPSESAGSTSVRYSGIDKEVVLQANLDKVVLKGEDGDDQFFFGDGFWTLNNLTSVHFKDFAKSIEVLADKGSDEIIFNNIVRIPNKLTLIGGKVKSDVPAIIEAKDLEMRFVKGAGTREAPLDIFVENLRVVDNSAPIYLRELNGVNLLGLQTDGIFDLVVLNGDVTQKDEVAGIEGAGNFTFWVEEGELKLESSKNFVTGSVGLFAKKAARFSNATATTLLESRAADLAVDSVGDISSESALRVSGETRLITSGNIVLKNEKNDFSRVSLVADGFVDLANNMDGSPEGRTLDLTGGDIDGDLNVQTGNNGILISGRVSSKGDISFVTAGGIRSKGEVNSYIEAQKFIARTDSGIGSEDRDLNLQVGIIDAINNGTSPILLANKGMLTVERIHSAGDIYLKNSESVKFLKNSVSAFYLGENEPLYPPGDKAQKENPSYGGNFQLTLEKGYILTDLSVDRYEPHIAARNAEILNYHGAFGAVPPVIYVPGRLFILSGLSRQPPIQGFDVKPHPYEDDTIYTGVFGAGEQIIEVENLAEIDPAIFTQVKNYFYQDISIRLSSDQLFEDEG